MVVNVLYSPCLKVLLTFINEGEPFNGTVVVSVEYIDGCGNKSLIEKRFVVGE